MKHEEIHQKWESTYIEQGGALTLVQRDQAFSEALEALKQLETTPIPMVLYCPACGMQHVDYAKPGKGWTNPPHRSHQCQGCNCVWRPADVLTTGVERILTKGKADSWKGKREPTAWAIFHEGSGELLSVERDEPERVDGEVCRPLFL